MPKKLIQDIIVSRKNSPAKKQNAAAPVFSSEEKQSKMSKNDFFAKKIWKGDFIPEKLLKKEGVKKKWKIKFPRFSIPRMSFLKSGAKLKFAGIVFAIIVIVICGDFLLNKFSSVVIEITPRVETAEADAALNATVEPQNNELPLEVMRMEKEESGSVKSSGMKEVSIKASGRIIIYNAYSSQPQYLVSNTRFEAPNGNIYRIASSITVPGAKIENGKISASETETAVFADKPGEEYNLGLVDFIIPGFQDAGKREKIYARSKTEITGGFIGQKSFITENDISSLQKSLREKIENYFLENAVNPKPDEFLLYNAAKKIIYKKEEIPKPGDLSDTLELDENAIFYGFLIKKEDLAKALVEKYLDPNLANQLEILNPENLEFELKNFSAEKISFSIKGKIQFAYKFDENSLKNGLMANKGNPDAVFGEYKNIEKAKITFKPSWWRAIPKDASRIEVKTVID